ncbi:MAG: hypothetical protein M1818_004059 [Claussenomyces sp. TS43310]|nr:MAG: hypothetical protein M1818_004059 [Claussenomyces sp. TS43310]
MAPGRPSDHLHTIMGGNGFGFEMSYNDTQASTCSSCTVTKDFSNYWVPTLFYHAENGSFINVEQGGGALIYYLAQIIRSLDAMANGGNSQRSDPQDPEYSNGLLAFPAGFRMTAGDPLLRSYNGTAEQQAISFACLGTQTAEAHELPNYNCPNGLRAQIFFPSCWDGVQLDSPDHKSHMSYPSIYNAGHCPPSHPKRFVSIFYEVIWNVDAFRGMWYGDSQPFVLSTGDKTGYSYHGDFINGWDVPTLQRAVTECTSDSGVIEECPVFDLFTNDFANSCKIPPSIDEQTTGVLPALPGCNPIEKGQGMASVSHNCSGVQETIGAPQYNYADLTVSKGFKYIGCGYDFAGQTRTLSGAQLVASNLTNAYCVDWCAKQNYTIAGTEYSSQCFCGNSMAADRMPARGLMGSCDMPCSGESAEMCGGNARVSLYQKCSSGTTCQNVANAVNHRTSPSTLPVSSSGTYHNRSRAASKHVSRRKNNAGF